MTQKVKISGLTCVACQKLITKRLKAIKGVQDVTVLLSGETEIIAGKNISNGEITKALEGTKYLII